MLKTDISLYKDFAFLTRDQVGKLFWPSRTERCVNARLCKLITSGVLSRRIPEGMFVQKVPLYYLGPKAHDALNVQPKDDGFLRQRRRASEVAPNAIPHYVLSNAVHIKFITSYSEGYELTDWIPMNDPLWSRPEFTVRPDGYGEYKKSNEEFRFFVESDMGTERGNTIRNRLARYYQLRQSGKFNEIFFTGDEFRVLFICRSRKRAKELHQMARIYPEFIFWFTDYETFLDRPLFDKHWLVSGCKDPHSLDI